MIKPSEVKEMNNFMGRAFECTGKCNRCIAEYICTFNNGKETIVNKKRKNRATAKVKAKPTLAIDHDAMFYSIKRIRGLPNCCTVHRDLKVAKTHFSGLWSLQKSCEIRYNDRKYKVGDILHLIEMNYSKPTGRFIIAIVTHVLRRISGQESGLEKNYVALSINIVRCWDPNHKPRKLKKEKVQ